MLSNLGVGAKRAQAWSRSRIVETRFSESNANNGRYNGHSDITTIDKPIVLYVYRCLVCGHAGEAQLAELAPEVTMACSACGAEVLAEWDGGVELVIDDSRAL